MRTPRTLVRSSLVAEPVRTNSDEQRRRIAYETRRRESGLQAFPLNRHFSLQAHTARRGKTTEKPYVTEIAAASWLKIYRESCWICFLWCRKDLCESKGQICPHHSTDLNRTKFTSSAKVPAASQSSSNLPPRFSEHHGRQSRHELIGKLFPVAVGDDKASVQIFYCPWRRKAAGLRERACTFPSMSRSKT